MSIGSAAQRQDLGLAVVVSAIANGVAYALAGVAFWATGGSGPAVSSMEGLIISWMVAFCATSALVGLPFLIWRRNLGAVVGWVFGIVIVQACAIGAGVVLGLLGYLSLPGG